MELKLEQGLNKSFIIKTERGKKLGYFVLDVDGYYNYKDELNEYFKNEKDRLIETSF